MSITRASVGLAAVILALLAAAATASAHEAGVSDRDTLEERGPIEIESDADFTAANGVRSGTGTVDDPFIIENWTIAGTGLYGVEVSRVSAHWILRNVLVDASLGADFTDGIYVENVTGGMIEHVEVVGQDRMGIYLVNADGTDVCEVDVASNGFVGVYAHRSHNMTWAHNLARDNFKHGYYYAFGSSHNRITASRSYGHFGDTEDSYGIYSGIDSNDNLMDNNTLHDNAAGIQVTLVKRNVIRDNTITNNILKGVSLLTTENTTVASNTISDNRIRGVLLAESPNSTITGNVIEGHEIGIESNRAGSHLVRGNVVRQNGFGIEFASSSSGSLVYDNVFSNTINARDPSWGNDWNVTKRVGPNIVGGPFIGGNYWSDAPLTLHDHDEDGLHESHGPYAIGIDVGGDWLPIATGPGNPAAAFTVSNDRPASLEPVAFTDASTPGSFPVTNWTWTFGDGRTGWGANVTHAYAEAGDYQVVLRVMDSYGLVDSATRVISTQNVLPEPRLAGGARVLANATNVTFDASPSFDVDGDVVRYSWDFGDGATASGERVAHDYAGEGTWAGALLVLDNRLGAATLPFLVTVDVTPPLTAAAVGGASGNGGWVMDAATLTLSASDGGSGVAATEWRVAGEDAWSAYATPLALAEGVHVIEYRSRDAAGNVEDVRAVTVRVDGTPPTTTRDGDGYAGPNAPIGLTAVDAVSGVARTLFRVGDAVEWRVYAGHIGVAGLPDGNVTVTAQSEDVAGNAEAVREFVVLVDATAPTLNLLSPAERSVTASGRHVGLRALPPQLDADAPAVAVAVGDLVVSADATDSGAGVATMRVLVDGSVVGESAGSSIVARWSPPPGAPQRHLVRVEAWDAVGNVALEERYVWVVGTAAP